ncbi:MAG: helix-turn-helix domain-containing protein [Phycisphaerae bacterium]|nr:helix-turn-helix domain-containing protein [Phycisphaerae bacterium]
MAKMFYNIEEAMNKLGCSEDKVRQLAQDGTLREFKDCGKSIFKVDEIDELAIGMVSGDAAGASPIVEPPSLGDSNMDISLADTAEDISLSGSTTGEIDLLSMSTGTSIGLSSTSTGDAISLGADDSLGELSLDDTTPANDDTVVTSFGTNALSASSLGDDDFAMGDLESDELGDQISLDSGSSGSGLLDLSREADETSLGAELLEEIYPGAEDFGNAAPAASLDMPERTSTSTVLVDDNAAGGAVEPMSTPSMPMAAARNIQMYDEASGKFGVMLLAPLLILIYMACVAFSSAMNVKLPMVSDTLNPKIAYIAVGGLVWVIIFLIISMAGGGSGGGASTASAKAKKAKPAKKASTPRKAKKKK